MAEVTEEQLKLAAKEAQKVFALENDPMGTSLHVFMRGLEAAAPLLQLPWDEPNGDEVTAASKTTFATGLPSEVLKEFVHVRNAALLPKPVDPRREAIRKGCEDVGVPVDDEFVSSILTALDEMSK